MALPNFLGSITSSHQFIKLLVFRRKLRGFPCR